ncbi:MULTISPECIES: GDP-L-fucose synthase [unclassified Helicobacter]|uniref:GDP-L-fucose synthase family protein n=1 Tax=unclassified Helicobacter TaxID=2593540 RepID=UPI001F571E7E|nr:MULTISPECIES: GDP-L-fucose synthase [unclassified Helicobacter]MCI2235368.1 GDP-L-fucose synthase [Helicobacter sp. CaF467b]MCI7046821.1 GDP-L-fucose synthase [Helicobacter sp.]
MNKKIKILLTGSTGMVGRNILEKSRDFPCEILSPDSKTLNLLDKNNVKDFLHLNEPDVVVHCAGLVGGIQANIQNPMEFLQQNAYMGLNLISECKEARIKTFLNLASSCMYPRNIENPLREEYLLRGELEPTNEGYALAKILSTKLCEYIAKSDPNLHYKTIIPCNLYGKYDKFDPIRAHLIPAVISKIHHAKVNNISQVEIWGDGQARREFMYAEDLAEFIFYAIKNFESMPQNLNVGLGHDYSIMEYYTIIADIIGYQGSFYFDAKKPSGMKQKTIDNQKLKKFGWSPKTNISEGIKKTYTYYLKEVADV